jgi:SAM-dependent methyltransferase
VSIAAKSCGACGADDVETVLDLGRQTVSSHFIAHPGEAAPERPLALAVCQRCGTVQLAQPFPFRTLVPPHDWITYREPEAHLDAVTEKLAGLPDLHQGSQILGMSFKDRTTLARLNSMGFRNTRLLDLYADLGAGYPNANIESVAGLMSRELAQSLTQRQGAADMVIARHVLEHAESLGDFLAALAELLKPDGYLILEVPECSANLIRQDYAMIWEEHAYYFNARTIRRAVLNAGFRIIALEVYRYPFEDIAVVYATKSQTTANQLDHADVKRDVAAARAYGDAFAAWTARYDALCRDLTADGRKLAAYGAGHLTCAFLHFHNLSRHFAYVIDDTPKKQNLFLPKSGIPVSGRGSLVADKIVACLFGLGPETEAKVIRNNKSYLDDGGVFYSMLADSSLTIRRLL